MTMHTDLVTRPGSAGSGCGCGGRGASAGGCGGGSCTCGGVTMVGHPVFVRPRFFAGQLLTEDDLELLGAYMTAKDRLHDRYLFGPGVVCGLEVICHPCGGGRVRVQPGYALDCCGNDIVVACQEEVDVIALIRDLRAAGLGEDCGDPCADRDTQGEGSEENGANGTRHYCLYIRYAEELADPVAAYATEEPCSHQDCEPSRVREGFRFVLRCEEPDRECDDLLSRIRKCLPPMRTGDVGDRARRLQRYGQPMIDAVRAADAPVGFDETDARRFTESLDALATALPEGDQEQALGDEQARSLTEHVRALASELARFQLQDEATRERLVSEHPGLDVERARATLARAAERLAGTVDRVWADRLDRQVAGTLLAQTRRLAEPEEAPLTPLEARMLVSGLPLGTGVARVLLQDEAALKEWLLDRLDQSPSLTDCTLREDVEAIPVSEPEDEGEGGVERGMVRRTGTTAVELAEAVRRYVADCICMAINPPCRPCTDTDVLLACVEIEDCEVVRVCNASRDYVLGGPTLRYWIPGLCRLHELVEEACCPPRAVSKPTDLAEAAALAYEPSAFAGEPTTGAPGADVLAALERIGVRLPLPLAPTSATAELVAGAPAAVAAVRGQDGDTAARMVALSDRIAELSEELTETRDALRREKGRVTRLQGRLPEGLERLTRRLNDLERRVERAAGTGRQRPAGRRGGDANGS
jgi:hypothetical protein